MIHRTVIMLAALLAFAQLAVSAPPVKLYVATNGNDAWSGKLPAPNAAKTDGPLASIGKARDIIQQMKAGGPLRAPVRVLLRGGTYRLDRPFALRPEDSGTAERPITYEAYPGEKPVLSGGRRLSGRKPWRGRIRSCSLRDLGLGGLRFRQLFYGGKRQILARWPNRDPERPPTGGFLYRDTPMMVGSRASSAIPAGVSAALCAAQRGRGGGLSRPRLALSARAHRGHRPKAPHGHLLPARKPDQARQSLLHPGRARKAGRAASPFSKCSETQEDFRSFLASCARPAQCGLTVSGWRGGTPPNEAGKANVGSRFTVIQRLGGLSSSCP